MDYNSERRRVPKHKVAQIDELRGNGLLPENALPLVRWGLRVG